MHSHYAADLISVKKSSETWHGNTHGKSCAIYSSIFILTKLYNQNSYQNFIHNFLLTIRIKFIHFTFK
jgi:hypothetical protein